jgi:hypothetical protein
MSWPTRFPIGFGIALALAGCVSEQRAFSHQFPDNRSEDFATVLGRLPEPRSPSSPQNTLREPLAVVTTHAPAGEPQVVAIAVRTGEERWSRRLDAQTRPEILGDLVLTSERHQLVALDLRTGEPRWTRPLADLAYVGASRDGDMIYYAATVGALGGARRVGQVVAVDAIRGLERWRHEVNGVFGQPVAVGGMVMVPWERQNLAILDGQTGSELARLRLTDDVLAWTFGDPTGVYYGHRSVYRLTRRSVTGRRDQSTHRQLPLPTLPALHEGEVGREVEIWDDGFLPKPGTRSARGRIRLYFAPALSPHDEEVSILADTYYFVYYRYVFGYDLRGNLRWARILEQDVIGAQATERGLFVVGEQGQMRLLDPVSGLDRWSGGVAMQLASVALDVAGFSEGTDPPGPLPSLREQLSAVAVDPDNRLVPARAYAILQLAQLPDPAITRDLLDLYAQQSMPGALRTAIAHALRSRRTGGEYLIEALRQRYDFIENTPAPPLEVIVPALLEMRAHGAVPGLVQQMNDHETPIGVLEMVVRAVVELGDASVVPALRHFLVLYRADSVFAEDPSALIRVAEGIFRLGGPEGRALLTSLADAPSTLEPLTTAIRGYFEAERREQEAIARRQAEEAQRALEEAARRAEAALPLRLTQEQINSAFAAHTDALRECIAGELARNPELGQVRLVFILQNDGRAVELGVAPNTPELVQCVQERVNAIEFPRFRQRRMRAQFVIRVRGGGGDSGERSASSGGRARIPPDAPWWAWWQLFGEANGTPPGEPRLWWERRTAPVGAPPTADRSGTTVTATTGGAPSDGRGGTAPASSGGRPWWLSADVEEEASSEERVDAPERAPESAPEPSPRGRRGRRGARTSEPAALSPSGDRRPTAEPPPTQPPAAPSPPAQPPAAPSPPTQPPAAQPPAVEPAAPVPPGQRRAPPPVQPEPPAEQRPWWAPAEGG